MGGNIQFRIKHEKLLTVVFLILSFIFLGGLSMAFLILDIPALYLLCVLVLQFIAIIVFIVVQSASTVITIRGRIIDIKYVFSKDRIIIDEIKDIQIDRYKRWHKNHFIEQRLKMTLTLVDDRTIVLNDTAMVRTPVLGIMARRDDVLPDEQVVLYQVYQLIKSQMN